MSNAPRRNETAVSETVDMLDLRAQEVTNRDAAAVRGGLNPQPLPPRYFQMYLYRF